MRLEQLQYLIKVVENGSFTSASAELHISQPSISQAIIALEKELGVQLLLRTRTGVKITDIGEPIVKSAKVICGETDLIKEIASSAVRGANQNITIVATQTINTYVLAKSIISLNSRWNNETRERIHIMQDVTTTAEQLVDCGEADFAVVPYVNPPIDSVRFDYLPLLNSQVMAMVRKQNPLSNLPQISFQQIQQYPLAMFSTSYITYRHLYDRISRHGSPNIISESYNPELSQTLTSNDNIIGFAYDLNVLRPKSYWEDSNIIMIPIQDPIQVSIGILMRKNKKLSKYAKALIVEMQDLSEKLQKDLDSYHKYSSVML